MTHQDEELLSRYLDGELDASRSRALEQRLEREPELQSALQRMRELDNALKHTFSTPRARRVPERVIRLLAGANSHTAKRGGANVLNFPSRCRGPRWGLAAAASILAASGLVLVQGTGQQLANQAPGADPVLARALETAPSRAEGWDTLADGRQVRALLTYAHTDGSWCREYLLSNQGIHLRGIACRQGENNWVTEVSAPQPSVESATEYRTASAGDSEEVAAYMDRTANGIALSAQKEEELIATGWR